MVRLSWSRRLLVVCLLTSVAVVGVAAGAESTAAGTIVELYPNPTTEYNHGEYVVVRLSDSGEWTLTDGHSTTQLPDETGSFAVTRHPTLTADHTDHTAVEPTENLRLAVSGDTLELRRDGQVVDRVEYEQAPESHRWRYDREPHWQPDGFELREPRTVTDKPVEPFVLPDDPDAAVAPLSEADDRLYLAAYTLTEERVAEELRAAADRGADVVVLVEGGPVGGMSETQGALLDSLVADGIAVRVMTGEQTRFRYHHAKYAVADDQAVILTENWKPVGTGGGGSRGWGITVDSAKTADELAAIFRHDTTWEDTPRWETARTEIDTFDDDSNSRSYPPHHPPQRVTADELTILAAPDNAAAELTQLIDDTDEELLIKQPQISDREFQLLRAAVRAAERGVDVRILLDDSWYVAEDNRELAAALNDEAASEEVSLEVRVVDSDDRFGKIHSKGIVADDTAVIGSLNWNNNSATNNREVAVAVEDEAVADYYREVFAADWDSNDSLSKSEDIPVGVIVVSLGLAAAIALLAQRRLTFET